MRRIVTILGLGLTLAGCAGSLATKKQPDLMRRAAWDMNCSQGELKIVPLSEWTRGVAGCTKKRVYVYDQPRESWMVSSETVPELAPAK